MPSSRTAVLRPRCWSGRNSTFSPLPSAHSSARLALDDVQTTPPRRPTKPLMSAEEFMYVTGTVRSARPADASRSQAASTCASTAMSAIEQPAARAGSTTCCAPASAPRPSRSRAVAVGEGSAQEVTSSWLHSAVAPGGSADVTCETPGVRVLICPDKFAGTLTAVQAAEAIAAGWSAVAPGDELVQRPLADGGTGFLDVIAAAVGGDEIPVPATDPLGRPVAARVLVAGTTGYVESAQV